MDTHADSSRADHAYVAIKQAIIEQALTPGTKLPEDALSAHFGVSRTLVRAALARLAADGLVDSRMKRTATVAQPSIEEARGVFEVRRGLEAEVVRLVIARWQPSMGAALEGHVRQEEQAAKRGESPVSARLAGEFHVLLARLCGNALMARYVSEVVCRCSLILAIYGRPHAADCAITEHRELVAALRRADEKTARRLMAQHLGSVERRALHAGTVMPDDDLGAILGRYTAAASVPAKAAKRAAPSGTPRKRPAG